MTSDRTTTASPDVADGELEPAGDRWRLRFRRALRHSPAVVWRAITDKDELLTWFPHPIVGDWVVGAPLTFVSGVDGIDDFEGEVLTVDEPHVLAFTWGPDEIRLAIDPAPDGCVLVLEDTFSEHGKAARDASGWHACLDKLGHALAGTTETRDDVALWKAINPLYVAKLGPAASTIGPPAEMPDFD